MDKKEIMIKDAIQQMNYHKSQMEFHKVEFERYRKVAEIIGAANISDNSTKLDESIIDNDFPDYPKEGTLFDKYRYLESKIGRLWSRDQMSDLIRKQDDPESLNDTLKNIPQRIHYYYKKKELWQIKYANKNKFTFYTTNKDWIIRTNDGFSIVSGREPLPHQLLGLSDEEKNRPDVKGFDFDKD